MAAPPFPVSSLGQPYDHLGRLPVSVLLDNVRSLYNVGAFFRTAAAVGVERLYLSGVTGRPPRHAISKTALGAETLVPWAPCDDPLALFTRLRDECVELAAIETSVHAVDLFEWHPRFPVCVIFGHEVDGVQAMLLDACDAHVRIPTPGVKHSLNVATSGGVVLYELLRRYRALSRAPRQ